MNSNLQESVVGSEIIASERQQELIFNNSVDLTFLLAVEGIGRYRFITVNNAFLSAARLTREQVEGKYAEEVIPTSLYPAIFTKYAQAIREQQTVQWEDTSDYPDGRKTGIISVTPIFNEKGVCTMLVGTLHDITERKKTEERLRLREKQLDLIYNKVGDVIFLLSIEPDSRYLFTSVNNAFLYTTGLKREQVEGKYVDEVIPETSLAFVLSKYKQAIEERRSIQWEETTEYPSGIKAGIVTITPIFDKHDNCTMLVGAVHDITERKKAQEEKDRVTYLLHERVKELTTLYKADQILNLDKGSSEDVLNDLVSILPQGWQYPDITEARISLAGQEYTTPQFHAKVNSQFAEFSIPGEKNGRIEVAYTKETPEEAEGPFFTEERNMLNMLAEMLRIYFLRKSAITQLQREKELSDKIVETLPGLFYMIDTNGKYIRWNKLKETISGYTHEEMSAMQSLDFFDGEDRDAIREAIVNGFKTGSTEVEAHVITKDNKRILYYFTGIVIEYEGKPCLMGMGIDVTEKKLLEQEILKQRVQEQKKITRAVLNGQEKERNNIGQELHDNVNQILAGAKMFLGMAKESSTPSEKLIKESMALIDSAIKEIKILTREQVTPRKQIDLKDLIYTLMDKLSAHSAIQTNFVYDIGSFKISEDLKLNIYRIIQEGINNILKHAAAKNVTISVKAVHKALRVSIIDDGKGLDITKKSKGIGIANIFNRVESYNGTVTIDSSPKNGCKIELVIPASI